MTGDSNDSNDFAHLESSIEAKLEAKAERDGPEHVNVNEEYNDLMLDCLMSDNAAFVGLEDGAHHTCLSEGGDQDFDIKRVLLKLARGCAGGCLTVEGCGSCQCHGAFGRRYRATATELDGISRQITFGCRA